MGLFLLVGQLDRLGWPEQLAQLTLGGVRGPRLVTYVLTGLGLAVLERFDPELRALDPALALLAGWDDVPDLAGLRAFYSAGTLEERQALLAALGVGDPQNATPPAAAATWAQTFTPLAHALIRSLVARIRGFERASPAFARRHFLALPGHAEIRPETLDVHLAPAPYHVALHLAGLDASLPAVSWLAGRRLTLKLEGL